MGQPLTTDRANAVYDVLVEYVRATEDDRGVFLHRAALGMPSPFRLNVDFGWPLTLIISSEGARVSAELIDPQRKQAIDTTNRALADLNKQGS